MAPRPTNAPPTAGMSQEAAHAILKALQGHSAWDNLDPDIQYDGKMITLPGEPSKMPIADAIKHLQRKLADEEMVMNVVEIIDTYPTDGAVAFVEAMKRRYGWASPVPTPGFFGPQPPVMRSIQTGPGDEDVIQVPWGRFLLPNVEGNVNTSVTFDNLDGRPMFMIHGQLKKKDHAVVKELAAITREVLKTGSIYKGKAIQLRTNDSGEVNYDVDPQFLPLDHIDRCALILNPGEGDQIQVALWTPIEHTADCIKYQIPLKRGVLLEGPYGCGKTLTSSVTSKICVDNGWTFISLDDVRGLEQALLFAKRYAPAVVFAEDIDRIAEQRDQRGNDLLNTIDGIVTKNSQVITVLTTNFVEKLDPAMLRPGRLDAVISVRAPESESVQKLVQVYARGLLEPGTDLASVGDELAGQIPATIREVAERSKLGMVNRGASTISADDLLIAARGMKRHLELLAKKPPEKSVGDKLADSLRAIIDPAHQDTDTLERIEQYASNAEDNAEAAASRSRQIIGMLENFEAEAAKTRKRA